MNSCYDCRFYDSRQCACMKDYRITPIMDEDETGSNCVEFDKGLYNAHNLGEYDDEDSYDYRDSDDEEYKRNSKLDDDDDDLDSEEEEDEEFEI